MKLMVVDDERMTREGIAAKLAVEPGIEAVEQADSGVSAIGKLDDFRPDIVLTDVRMPSMDGIALAAEVRSRLPDCKIIFMSGFSDKAYLKSAIKLKALNYIEKPIDLDELRDALQAAVRLREEERSASRRADELSRLLAASLPLLKAELAARLTADWPDIGELYARARAAGLTLPAAGCFQSVVVRCAPRAGGAEADGGDARGRLGELAEAFWRAEGFECLTAPKDAALLVCHLFGGGRPAGEGALRAFAARLAAAGEGRLHLAVACGPPVAEAAQLARSYRAAAALMPAAFYKESGALLRPPDGAPRALAFDAAAPEAFAACAAREDEAGAERMLRGLAEQLRRLDGTPVDAAKSYFLRLLAALHKDEPAQGGEPDRRAALRAELERCATLQDALDFALGALRRHMEALRQQRGATRIVREVKRVIHERYADERLTIRTICGHTYLSPAYLCSLFKAHTGQTINGYLTAYRVGRAKALLDDPRLTIQQIAAQVGYSNSNYFAKVFRKAVGMAPTEYREKA